MLGRSGFQSFGLSKRFAQKKNTWKEMVHISDSFECGCDQAPRSSTDTLPVAKDYTLAL